MAIEALRIYLGLALVTKGIQFTFNQEVAQEYLQSLSLPAFDFVALHIIVMVHIGGGLLLAIGFITRIAALIQIPVLLGAVFFVHLQQGLFTKAEDLEFVILVLFLLLVFVVYGGGRLSADYYIERRTKKVG